MLRFPFDSYSLQASDQHLSGITLNVRVRKKITGSDVAVTGGAHLINVVTAVSPFFRRSVAPTGAVTSFNRQRLYQSGDSYRSIRYLIPAEYPLSLRSTFTLHEWAANQFHPKVIVSKATYLNPVEIPRPLVLTWSLRSVCEDFCFLAYMTAHKCCFLWAHTCAHVESVWAP